MLSLFSHYAGYFDPNTSVKLRIIIIIFNNQKKYFW